MLEALIILVLLLATVYYITAPLFQEPASSQLHVEDSDTTDRYQQIGDELAEIEFELKAGKLPEEDYLNQRNTLRQERELLD